MTPRLGREEKKLDSQAGISVYGYEILTFDAISFYFEIL